MQTLTQVLDQVEDGHIFSVDFIKRSDGTIRHMVCRRGVDRTNGSGRWYSDEGAGVMTVWDMTKKAYRTVPLEGILTLKINGKEYQVG